MSTPLPSPPQKKRAGRDLRAAIGVGVGLGAVIVASLFIVKAVFVGVIALAVVVGLWELTSRLQEQKGIKAPLIPLAVGGAAMVVAGYARGAEGAWVAMALTALAVLVWRMTVPPDGYLKDVTAGVFAAFYVPFLATFVAMMLTADDGHWRVLVFLVLTVVSDTGAYAVGWRYGTHKLAPRISPGKTREGLLGAVAFAMVAGALCMEFLIDGGAWWQGLLLGLAVAVSATLGDLGESMIKRTSGSRTWEPCSPATAASWTGWTRSCRPRRCSGCCWCCSSAQAERLFEGAHHAPPARSTSEGPSSTVRRALTRMSATLDEPCLSPENWR